MESIIDLLKAYRPLQLQVNIFNGAYAYVIFTFKLMCLALVIFGLSFAVRFHVATPLISGNNAFYGIYLMALFIAFYDNVFQLPAKINNFKRNAKIATYGIPSGRENAYCKITSQIIRSIPAVGIKVGDVGFLERQSTPTFVDFSLRSICSILVALN